MNAIKSVQQIKGLSLVEKAILYATALNEPEGAPMWLIEIVAIAMLSDHMKVSSADYDSHDKQLHRRLDAHARVLYRAMQSAGAA